jgi:4-amino-4-deoxy-L-arabinose transferase-like glycosyltransferase
VARFVSIAFGAFVVAMVLALGYRWGGARRGWLAALILVAMPEFYKYSHLIVLDIAVVAFVTLAMAAFIWWLTGARHASGVLCVFYAAAAGAFLTKGLAGVFHIAVTVTVFCLITGRWSTFVGLLRPLPMLFFVAPVSLWLLLFYREGGIAYLHEHFVNNVIGRFLGVQFQLAGAEFGHTDVGTPKEWSFYLTNALRTFGLAALALPFALWAMVRGTRLHQSVRANDYSPLPLLLAVWALLPAVLLSFSANKETSYVLPSCAAVALLSAWWLDERLLPSGAIEWRDAKWFAVILPAAAMSVFGSWIDVGLYRVIAVVILAAALLGAAGMLWKRRFMAAIFGLFGAAACLTILTNSPNINAMEWGFGRTLSDEAWTRTGQADLYLYHPDDIARGCVPFYRNRLTPEIDRPSELQRVLALDRKVCVLMRTEALDKLRAIDVVSSSWQLQPLPNLDARHQYILISNTP